MTRHWIWKSPVAILTGCLILAGSYSSRALAGEPAREAQAATQPTAGILHVDEPPLKTAGSTPRQTAWLEQFATSGKQFVAQLSDVESDSTDPWRVMRVSFPSPVETPWPENNTVPGELYLPRNPPAGKMPAAVVLDILDGSAIVPRGLARGMAERGIAALYVPMACYGVRRPAHNAHIDYFRQHPNAAPDNFRQSVMDIRRAKAVLAALPGVNADQISIAGVSMGGIMTSLAAGVDGTFYRVVPILAGGDIAAITFHAREGRAIRQALEDKGITQPMLADLLRPVDPLSFANRINPASCLMINASKDEVIPRATTDALYESIGKPQILWVPVGHYGSIFYLPNIRTRVIDFILGKKVESLELTQQADR